MLTEREFEYAFWEWEDVVETDDWNEAVRAWNGLCLCHDPKDVLITEKCEATDEQVRVALEAKGGGM